MRVLHLELKLLIQDIYLVGVRMTHVTFVGAPPKLPRVFLLVEFEGDRKSIGRDQALWAVNFERVDFGHIIRLFHV